MATSQMSEVIQHLRRAVLVRDGAGLTDGQLLGDYISRREEASLAALVRRHGPMVWLVCRRVLSNYHDAEDAFQATFLVLVRKAASIASRELLANWLYGVAYQTALNARATAARRRAKERQVTEMPEPEGVQQDVWHDVQPLLDQELSRLPDKYRIPLVLCDLGGKTRKEAAQQLACPEGTVAGRLARARVMLAKRLARHGLAVSVGALAAVLSQSTASASVPTSVVSSTIKAASLFVAGQAAAAGVISLKVTALTEGVLKTMLLAKLKIATVLVLGTVLACAGAGLLCKTLMAAEPTEAREEPAKERKGDDLKKDTAKGDANADALKRMQGTWDVVSLEYDGVPLGADHDTSSIVVEEERLLIKGAARLEPYTIKLDAGAKPPRIDMTLDRPKSRPAFGIFEFQADKLIIVCAPVGETRPDRFDGKSATKFVLRKAKAGEGKADDPKQDTPKGDAAREAEQEKEKEAAKLKGKWKSVAVEIAGHALPEDTAKTNVWDIADGKITRKLPANDPKGGKEEEVVPFRIDPTKKPAHIDLEVEVAGIKGVMKGIYKLDGDELTVCLYGADGGRPTEFTSSDLGNGQKGGNILMKFKREKEDKEKKEEK